MKKFEILEFPRFNDEKGSLIPFEFSEIPFPVKRVYLVKGKEKVVRGKHAHLIEDELFVAVSGSVILRINDGAGDQEILLDSPQKGVLIRKHCWHELDNFAENTVVMAFSSTSYLPGETNYLTDKKVFLEKFGV